MLPGLSAAHLPTTSRAKDPSPCAAEPRAPILPAFAMARRAFAAHACGGVRAPDHGVVELRDVPYAVLGGRSLHLDFARPEGPGRAPVVLLVHGGGFRGGDKRDLERLLLGLAARGYAAASVEYRLVGKGEAEFPAGVADVRCAARFLESRADTLHIDAHRMAAVGFSAGGPLAASLALQSEVPALDADCPYHDALHLDAAVAFYAPLDFRPAVPWGPLVRAALREVLTKGRPHRRLHELEKLASPIAYADSRDTPLLLLHGTDDRIVPIARAREALRQARSAGAPLDLLELRGAPHGFGMSRPGAPRGPACAALAFLRARFGGES